MADSAPIIGRIAFFARRRWRWGLALGIALAIWLGHGLLFYGLASVLVVRQPIDGATFLVLRGHERGVLGANGFRAAADFCRRDPSHRVLLIGHRPGRLVELGILPPWETFARNELERRGVPASAVTVVEGNAVDEWDDCRLLGAWLKARPEATVAVAVNPLGSRRVRHMLDAAMAPPEAALRTRLPPGRSPVYRGQLASKPIGGEGFYVRVVGIDLCLASRVGPADAAAAGR